MERPDKKIKIKRVKSDGNCCNGCIFNAGGECWMPQCAEDMYVVDIEGADTINPFSCDGGLGKNYIFIRQDDSEEADSAMVRIWGISKK